VCAATASLIQDPVAAAVALETLAIYEELDTVGHVRRLASVLQDGLRALAGHPLVGEVRGMGFIGALELVADKSTRRSFAPAANVGLFIEQRCQEHGGNPARAGRGAPACGDEGRSS
jgi:4-aminobutyrate--pyruvate transaminase